MTQILTYNTHRALLFYLLSAHRSPSTISFVVIVVIMATGLIFNSDDKEKNLLQNNLIPKLKSYLIK